MLDQLRSLLRQWRDLGELDRLSDRDIADIGISRAELTEIVQLPQDSPERMAAMARVFGLTEAELKRDRGEYLELLEICGHCGHRGECGRALKHANSKTPADMDFCPNAGTYAAKAASH